MTRVWVKWYPDRNASRPGHHRGRRAARHTSGVAGSRGFCWHSGLQPHVLPATPLPSCSYTPSGEDCHSPGSVLPPWRCPSGLQLLDESRRSTNGLRFPRSYRARHAVRDRIRRDSECDAQNCVTYLRIADHRISFRPLRTSASLNAIQQARKNKI
jgi:hypothetical protein